MLFRTIEIGFGSRTRHPAFANNANIVNIVNIVNATALAVMFRNRFESARNSTCIVSPILWQLDRYKIGAMVPSLEYLPVADTVDKSQSSRHIPCAVHLGCQSSSTWNPGKSSTANGRAERACYFFRLCCRGAARAAPRQLGDLRIFTGHLARFLCLSHRRGRWLKPRECMPKAAFATEFGWVAPLGFVEQLVRL